MTTIQDLSLKFRWPWRPYQERVLSALETHFTDRKLHLVAAPGAGKTTLGLELFRRLGKPAVVLSPTRTIRDQWISRLSDFREGDTNRPAWTSADLDQPGLFTSITYQALQTQQRTSPSDHEEPSSENEDEEVPSHSDLEKVAARFRAIGVGTLILDEAHHLRQEWWKALTEFLEELPDVTLLSFTATPPYDALGAEWQRYETLCGPIDEEISVPELVRAGTLSPHQDFIWAVAPHAEDAISAREYDVRVEKTLIDLSQDEALLAEIERHPWVSSPTPDPAAVLEDPELAVAFLVVLRLRNRPLPPSLLHLLDVTPEDVPSADRRWWQVLIQRYLFDPTWAQDKGRKAHRDQLSRQLQNAGLLQRRELRLTESRALHLQISLTTSKIDACTEIFQRESAVRGEDLRQVILTDFIGDDGFTEAATSKPRRIGAWPVFRSLLLVAAEAQVSRMALLTGRLAIVHETLVPELRLLLGTAASSLAVSGVSEFPEFSRVSLAGSGSGLVAGFTELLRRGRIRVMVGTRALLGEGWDAPAVNSLVMASYVGSFMLTNQMRGRAIRKDPENPRKAASIWHLVAVDPTTRSGRSDLEDLHRRLRTFVGLHETQPLIENGFDRLSLPLLEKGDDLDGWNREAERRLEKIPLLQERWTTAIDGPRDAEVVPVMEVTRAPRFRALLFERTLGYLLWSAAQSFLIWFQQISRFAVHKKASLDFILGTLAVGAGVGLLFSLPKLCRALVIWIRHLPVDGSIRQIALALLEALCESDLLKTNRTRLHIHVVELEDGRKSVSLKGASFYEQSLFTDCLAEVLGPIENPRYLLTRAESGRWNRKKRDYHAVPLLLAMNKERATLFHTAWKRRLGPADLLYTRTEEGRKLLLRARARAFSKAFSKAVERKDRWQ